MITFILVLLICGVIVYLIRRSPVIDPTFKELATWLTIFVLLLYFLKVVGLWDNVKAAFEV